MAQQGYTKVSMWLTKQDCLNAQKVQASFDLRDRASAVSFSINLSLVLVEEVLNGNEVIIAHPERGLSMLVIPGVG